MRLSKKKTEEISVDDEIKKNDYDWVWKKKIIFIAKKSRERKLQKYLVLSLLVL